MRAQNFIFSLRGQRNITCMNFFGNFKNVDNHSDYDHTCHLFRKFSCFQLEVTSVDSEFVGLLQEIHKQNIPLHSYRGVILLHKNENCLVKKIQVGKGDPNYAILKHSFFIFPPQNIGKMLEHSTNITILA